MPHAPGNYFAKAAKYLVYAPEPLGALSLIFGFFVNFRLPYNLFARKP